MHAAWRCSARWRAATRSSNTRPAEIKLAVVGYGRAEKHQVGEMVRLLLGLDEVPEPHDASDALAVAICHVHCSSGPVTGRRGGGPEITRRAEILA